MLKFSNLRQSLPKIQCFPKFYSMSTTPSGFRETRRIPEKNYYKILGVGACSSGKEIKTAYIRLAKIYHPDTSSSHSQEAKNHFQDIAEAYEVLSDRQKRRLYDKFGFVVKKIPNKTKITTNDFFKELLWNANVVENVTASLTFVQSIRGGAQSVKLKLKVDCKACQGIREVKTLPGKCRICEGKKKIEVEKEVKVTIPENYKSGQTVDIPSPLDPEKTLRISFVVNSDKGFRQEGFNIFNNLEISLTQALLGDNVTISGTYGDFTLRIPAGIQSNTVMKLPGRGIRKNLNSQEAGDHFITVVIIIPKRLTKIQMELIRAFAETEECPKNQ